MNGFVISVRTLAPTAGPSITLHPSFILLYGYDNDYMSQGDEGYMSDSSY